MSRFSWVIAGVLVAVIAASSLYLAQHSPISADGRAMVLPVDPNPLIAETRRGERSFTVEIADDMREREQGLMFREQMDDDHGMLFVFEDTRDVGFWMKNTPLPLDLIFIGQDGTVRAIKRGEPLSPALISPNEPVRFVLEVKAGIAEKTGIEDGDRIRHPAIDAIARPGQGNPE
jgi:uncharacterized membrane protein (UPF0127 family)